MPARRLRLAAGVAASLTATAMTVLAGGPAQAARGTGWRLVADEHQAQRSDYDSLLTIVAPYVAPTCGDLRPTTPDVALHL